MSTTTERELLESCLVSEYDSAHLYTVIHRDDFERFVSQGRQSFFDGYITLEQSMFPLFFFGEPANDDVRHWLNINQVDCYEDIHNLLIDAGSYIKYLEFKKHVVELFCDVGEYQRDEFADFMWRISHEYSLFSALSECKEQKDMVDLFEAILLKRTLGDVRDVLTQLDRTLEGLPVIVGMSERFLDSLIATQSRHIKIIANQTYYEKPSAVPLSIGHFSLVRPINESD